MLVSELIKLLQEYKQKHGDVQLFSESADGRSSWYGSTRCTIRPQSTNKIKNSYKHVISVDGGY